MAIKSVVECLPTLEKLAKAKTKKERVKLLQQSKSCIYYSISEISKNTLNGNIPTNTETIKNLAKYKSDLRLLSRRSGVPLRKRKEIVLQSGGAFLPALLWPAISYLGGKLVDKVLQ